MENEITYYFLRTLGMAPQYSRIVAESNVHFVTIVNEEKIRELWKAMTGRANVKAELEIEKIKENWENEFDIQKMLDSIFLVCMVGVPEKVVLRLIKNGFNNIHTLKNMNDEQLLRYREIDVSLGYRDAIVWVDQNRGNILAELTTEAPLPENIKKSYNEQVVIETERKAKPVKRSKNMRRYGVEHLPDSFSEFCSLEYKNSDILMLKLDGSTLQEIGDIKGVTRERIRQIIWKIIQPLPEFSDIERLKNLVTHYEMSVEDFCRYTGSNKRVYNFIKLKYDKVAEQQPIEEFLLHSGKLSREQVDIILKEKGKFINHEGEIVGFKLSNIVDEVLYKHRDVFNIKTIRPYLLDYYSEHSSEEMPSTSDRALAGMISRQKVIQRTNGYFRYYPYSIDEILEFKEELQTLFDVPDGVYGIEYFYDSNIDLMNVLEIYDATELANLFKKIGYKNFDRLNDIVRQSQVYIGSVANNDSSKEAFYLSILNHFDGHPLEEVAKYLFDNYSIHQGTALSYLGSHFSQFIQFGIIEMDHHLPDDDDFYEKLSEVLYKPIYTFDQAQEIVKNIDEDVALTANVVVKAGYDDRGSSIVRADFITVDSALESLWLNSDYVFNSEVKKSHSITFTQKLYNLELSHDLIRIDSERYMSIKKFEKSGVRKSDIQDFIDEVLDFVKQGEYFTWVSICEQGFHSEFIDRTGFDDYFYDRLISTSEHVDTINTVKKVYIYGMNNDNKKPKLTDFIEQKLNVKKIDIDDFLTDIQDEFGLELPKSTVIEKLKSSPLSFSSEMNKIYIDEDTMYKDIYEGEVL